MPAPNLDTLLTIARVHLFFDTLDVRNVDTLDFRVCGVASVRAALEAAYAAGFDAGKAAALAPPPAPELDRCPICEVRDAVPRGNMLADLCDECLAALPAENGDGP